MNLIETGGQLDEVMSRPSPEVIRAAASLEGDIVILGIAGKMGPSLALQLKRALQAAGVERRIYGVSRFSTPAMREELERAGISTIACDLLDDEAVDQLPEAANIIYLAGRKFGSTGDEALTWAVNTHVPGIIVRKYRNSRIVALSTGNVYPMMPVAAGGAREEDAPGPVGEYAQSCLGRERIFQYFCRRYDVPAVLIRLNYAIDLRYGVLADIARDIMEGRPVNLSMGYVNIIWQGDANAAIIRSLGLGQVPPLLLNLTGREALPVRQLALELGRRLKRQPLFEGSEQATAFLSNTERYQDLLGGPSVTVEEMLDWTAGWVKSGGASLGKPTHFQERQGKF